MLLDTQQSTQFNNHQLWAFNLQKTALKWWNGLQFSIYLMPTGFCQINRYSMDGFSLECNQMTRCVLDIIYFQLWLSIKQLLFYYYLLHVFGFLCCKDILKSIWSAWVSGKKIMNLKFLRIYQIFILQLKMKNQTGYWASLIIIIENMRWD